MYRCKRRSQEHVARKVRAGGSGMNPECPAEPVKVGKRDLSSPMLFVGLVASICAVNGAAFAVTADAEGAFSPAASWIGAKGRFFHYNTRKELRTAAVYAKDFALAGKPRAATLTISVAGYWDIRVNGRAITRPTPCSPCNSSLAISQ